MIDTQVHFREPGLEHKEDLESGTRAALMGGVTTIFEMPNTNPPTTTAEALAQKLRLAEGRAWCNYAFFVGASPENSHLLATLENLAGTPGVKIFMGSSTGSLLVEDDETLRAVLRSGKRPCPVHSEDEPRLRERKALLSSNPHPREHPFLRDEESARLSTERLIRLVRETGRPVHILHISSAAELPLLRQAKEEGLPITCEITPQHLLLDSSWYETIGAYAQMNPPIRSSEVRSALNEAFQNDLFDVFGSDHAPHTKEEKAKPYPQSPSGMPGVQTILPLLIDQVLGGSFTFEKLVRMGSENPASLYGIAGKGQVKEGFDADLVVVDPGQAQTVTEEWLESKCGWSPYTGQTLRGKVRDVVIGGHWSVQGGARIGEPKGSCVSFDWKEPA
jgi:dihydroorotase